MPGQNTGSLTPDRKRVTSFDLTEPAWITRMHTYVRGGGDSQTIRGVIYSDNNGLPDILLATTIEFIIFPNLTQQWVRMNLINNINLQPGKYWLGLITGPSLDPARIYFTENRNRTISTDAYSDGPSSPFGQIDATLSGAMSVIAMYQKNTPSQCPSGACAKAKWSAPEDSTNIIGYRLYYGLAPGNYLQFVETEANVFETQVQDLMPNTNYCFALKSFNSLGTESQFSNEICIVTNASEGVIVNFP